MNWSLAVPVRSSGRPGVSWTFPARGPLTERVVKAVSVLEELGRVADAQLPTLIEPWQVLLLQDNMAAETEITVNARFQFGTAADSRPALAGLIFNALQEAEIIAQDAPRTPGI